MRHLIPILSLALVMVGCEHSDPVGSNPAENSTFDEIQTSIFNTSCALSGCHAGSNPQQGMDLSAGRSYDAIVNAPSRERPDLMRVEPGNPGESYLLMKIEGAQGIVGARMPLGRSPLSDAQISLVRGWIAEGAPRD